MWKHLAVLIIIAGLAYPEVLEDSERYDREYFDEIIDRVNNAGAHWIAGHNFEDKINPEHLFGSLSSDSDDIYNSPKKCIFKDKAAMKKLKLGAWVRPKTFNGLKAWPQCPSVSYVWNQGQCASDWIIAPVSAITDRICIQSNGTYAPSLSPELPLSCCKSCGWACKKGYPKEVLRYWVEHGLVTGGAYRSEQGCQPYSIKPRRKMKRIVKHFHEGNVPRCQKKCTNPLYKKSFDEDLHKGYEYWNQCPCCAVFTIKEDGPITATMALYEDFLTYKSGIYHRVYGKEIGKLTVKVVGFNDTSDPKYWIAVNSWGRNWGEDGTFKILKGVGECQFEWGFTRADLKQFNDEFYDDSSSYEDW